MLKRHSLTPLPMPMVMMVMVVVPIPMVMVMAIRPICARAEADSKEYGCK
jgi:hypothetical protein